VALSDRERSEVRVDRGGPSPPARDFFKLASVVAYSTEAMLPALASADPADPEPQVLRCPSRTPHAVPDAGRADPASGQALSVDADILKPF